MANEPFEIQAEDRFDRLRAISWWDQERLAKATIMVVGAGALGNEVLKNLALIGIGRLIVVDRDRIEPSNLVRSVLFRDRDCGQAKAEVACRAAQELYPDLQAIPFVADLQTDIGLEWLHRCDLILGCLDNREARLWLNRCCRRLRKAWIDGGLGELQGTVQLFHGERGACYECGLKEDDYRLMNARYSCTGLRSDRVPMRSLPTTPTMASIVGAWQAQLALKVIHGMEVPWGHALIWNGMSDSMYRVELPTKSSCLSHEVWDIDWDGSDREGLMDLTVKQILEEARDRWQGEWTLRLERPLIGRLTCQGCDRLVPLDPPRREVEEEIARCPSCREWMVHEWISSVDAASPVSSWKLQDLAVPSADWIRLSSQERVKTIVLPGCSLR